ncbi:hypothetical protein [Roseimaritima ulvae]|uniref:hypothetical protein n=1 Tax=Roseimaritima ulvae TaxID=980254 RepID=UPI000830B021|nr:hypothetical protein [Roseimaritima ulvae]
MEDFPSSLSGCNAQGLLAAWSAPWHPALIATSGKTPTWCRADVPPAASKGMFLLIPEVSEGRLPHDFATAYGPDTGVTSLRSSTRSGFLDLFPLAEIDSPDGPVEGGHRPVAPEDFFALAYIFLQVQLMTRQLRYTSNLDEVHFTDVVVAAAKSWQAGDGAAAADSLHAAFDLLAQERDHYFSSDPHLVDLTLLAPTTLGHSLQTALTDPRPQNLLLDASLADRLAEQHPDVLQTIRERFADGSLGLAGGAPDGEQCLDHLTVAELGHALSDAKRRFTERCGKMPDAFASYSGGIPADLAPWIAGLGYTGTIPLDFAAGTGFRDENKLLWQAGAVELEALVAKPIDAADDAEFLRLGATLGSAVDAGDVATALLVHWPGQACTAFEDLRRAADWGLALGRFWTLGGYFSEGEKPYHSFQAETIAADGHWLSAQVEGSAADPLSTAANRFRQQLDHERNDLLSALTDLVTGTASSNESSPARDGSAELVAALAASGGSAATNTDGSTKVLLNPYSVPLRVPATLQGHPPQAKQLPQLFAAHPTASDQCVALVDVPSLGFATIAPGRQPQRRGWFSKEPQLAVDQALSNEFLDAVIGDDGSLASVHSGPVRGNRLSLQLCHLDADREPRYSSMQADKIYVSRSDGACGEITSEGRLLRGDTAIGEYQLRYRVEAGSRWLEVEGQLDLLKGTTLGGDPWRSYIAARAAVASEAARFKVLLRDKIHKVRGRRLNAPLGVLVDEADRQTLVLADGRPAHRVCGTRMLDSLLMVAGESQNQFKLQYGFDVKSPVSVARSRLSPAVALDAPSSGIPVPVGWLLQLDARNVLVSDAVAEQVDGRLEMVLLLIETRGKATKTRLHFYRNPQSAQRMGDEQPFECEQDAVKIVLGGFETLQLRVRF